MLLNSESSSLTSPTSSSPSPLNFLTKSLSIDIISGGFAGGVTRIFTAPLDVIKIRYQLIEMNQNNKISSYKTNNIFSYLRSIIRNEGFFALWKGNLSATYLWISYSIIQFSSFGALKNYILRQEDLKQEALANVVEYRSSKLFCAGLISSIISTVATYPFDIMRTTFAMQGKDRSYHSIPNYIETTFKTKGIRGFYSGIGAAIIVTPGMALNFSIYETLKKLVFDFKRKSTLLDDYNVPDSSINGFIGGIAGGTSKLMLYPFDTVKKRMQAQEITTSLEMVGGSTKHNNFAQCFVSIFKNEGIISLYKGLTPTLAKSFIGVGLTFMSFEGSKKFLSNRHTNKNC